MASQDDQTRKKRIDRIRPFLKELCARKEPKTNKAVLLLLIQDLKDEGNSLFKDGQFMVACDHYKHALFVAQVLEERFYHEVENEFMATLYSNGALGFLKTNKFTDALQYADKALLLQPDNVKARYRKVQALFSLRRYKEVLTEAQAGMKKQPSIFKEYITKAEEAIRINTEKHSTSKSASASVREQIPLASGHTEGNEWLADTNALKTEKQRQAALKKMPKKKKEKNSAPAPRRQARDASESDYDSDSSNLSEDSQFATNYVNIQRKGQASAKATNQRGGITGTHGKPFRPDHSHNAQDALYHSLGFTTVGNGRSRTQSNNMGLDDFGGHGHGGARPKGPPQNARNVPLPPINIHWPFEDSYQFRLVCSTCFLKIGDGYKGFSYSPNMAHHCGKDVLIIRRIDNQSLNWIKIRPLPKLYNSRFVEFKMCQQFVNSVPCKIGEPNCTFPHNKNEMALWYMEREGSFSHSIFLNQLRNNGIDTSEKLAARKEAEKAGPQYIPGLNYKSGQRRSSPAPLSRQDPRHPPQHSPSPGPSPRAPVPPPPLVTPKAAPFVFRTPAASGPKQSANENLRN